MALTKQVKCQCQGLVHRESFCDKLYPMLRSTLLIAICALASAVAFGQDDAQYQTLMKSMQPSVGAVRMAIMAKDNAAVAAAANKLAGTFDEVAAFWQKRNVADAVEMAQKARDAAKEVAAATTTEDQTADLRKVQAQCGACHMAHRAGMPGAFTIK